MAKTGNRPSSDRITISLGEGQREALEEISDRNGVGLSFVVRHAIEHFLDQNRDRQLPLDFRVTSPTADGGRRSS